MNGALSVQVRRPAPVSAGIDLSVGFPSMPLQRAALLEQSSIHNRPVPVSVKRSWYATGLSRWPPGRFEYPTYFGPRRVGGWQRNSPDRLSGPAPNLSVEPTDSECSPVSQPYVDLPMAMHLAFHPMSWNFFLPWQSSVVASARFPSGSSGFVFL